MLKSFRLHVSVYAATLITLFASCSQNPPLVYLSRQGVGSAEETQRYYAAMGRDGGRPAAARLDQWFAERCFDKEPREAFYYNPTDLGLGREMRCAICPQDDPRAGLISCAVSNHGTPLGIAVKQAKEALLAQGQALTPAVGANLRDAAIEDALKKVAAYVEKHPVVGTPQLAISAPFRGATVTMDYDPKLPANERIRFYVYDGEDPDNLTAPNITPAGLLPGLQLDNEGVKFIRNCLNCHGGVYDEARDTIVGSSFLDFNTPQLKFGRDELTSRSKNEAALRALNQLVLRTDPAAAIRARVCSNYSCSENGGVTVLSGNGATAGVLAEWSRDAAGHRAQENRDLYLTVMDKYCATCHFSQRPETVALTVRLRDQTLLPELLAKRPIVFQSPEQWFDKELQQYIQRSVCQASDMPHAEVTRMNLLSDETAFLQICGAPQTAAISRE